MIVMKNNLLFILSAVLLVSCGPKHDSSEIVPIPDKIAADSFNESISSINLVPLSSQDESLMGQNVELHVWGKSFVIADKSTVRISRFSQNGSFTNGYGKKGRGPQEFSSIDNIQIKGDTLVVFAERKRILKFLQDGTWVSTNELDNLGIQSIYTGKDILTYNGYMNDGDPRLSLIENGIVSNTFLKTNKAVMVYTPWAPVFSESKKAIYFIDSYSSIINRYYSKEVEPFISFDFGRYSISEQFYQFDNRTEGARFLLSSEYGLINRFCADGEDFMVEVMIQAPNSVPTINYGLYHKDKWIWFTCGDPGVDPFAGMFQLYKDGLAYFLLDPSLVNNIPPSVASKINNADVLNSITEESNYVLAEVCFK